MKIMFITSSSINGGAQKHIRDMFLCLRAEGNDMYLVAPDGWLTSELKQYSEKIFKIDAYIKNIKLLRKYIEVIKPDITNTFILSGGIFGCAAWKKLRIGKLFVTVNNPVLYDGISIVRRLAYPVIYQWMSCFASAFLVKSERVREETELVIRRKKPVLSIKNGVDFSTFNKDGKYVDLRSKYKVPKDACLIANVGVLEQRKGQAYLIKAVGNLFKRDIKVFLFIAGDGSEKKALEELCAAEKISSSTVFFGTSSDINTILANSDIFVLPSLYEGLPNALMEAMSMALPCVATDVGGASQLIDSGESGYLIEPKSSSQIEKYLERLVSDKNERRKMGLLAYKKIKENYDLKSAAKQLLEIYFKY